MHNSLDTSRASLILQKGEVATITAKRILQGPLVRQGVRMAQEHDNVPSLESINILLDRELHTHTTAARDDKD